MFTCHRSCSIFDNVREEDFLPLNLKVPLFSNNQTLFVEDSDDANMYLKLYKLAFGSVSLLPTENEVMLQVSPKKRSARTCTRSFKIIKYVYLEFDEILNPALHCY